MGKVKAVKVKTGKKEGLRQPAGPLYPKDCHKIMPKKWKQKCRSEKKACDKIIVRAYTSSREYCLYTPEQMKQIPKLPNTVKATIKTLCKELFHEQHSCEANKACYRCYWVRCKYEELFGNKGIYHKPGDDERHAKMAQDSGNAGTWLGVGALLILFFGIIGAFYWFLFRGKKNKGSAKGANKTSKSKLGGKSKISSRKSSKKSAKASLGSKSKASQKGSKGGKSRRSKSSAKVK